MASRRFPIVFYKWITNFGKSSFDYSNITDNIIISGEYTSNDIFTIQKLNVKCVQCCLESQIETEKLIDDGYHRSRNAIPTKLYVIMVQRNRGRGHY